MYVQSGDDENVYVLICLRMKSCLPYQTNQEAEQVKSVSVLKHSLSVMQMEPLFL